MIELYPFLMKNIPTPPKSLKIESVPDEKNPGHASERPDMNTLIKQIIVIPKFIVHINFLKNNISKVE